MRPFFIGVIGVGATAALVLALLAPYAITLHDPDALSLDASLSQTSALQGQTVTATVTEQNKLLVSNDLPAMGNWRVRNLSFGACSIPENSPFGLAVYQGRYTLENASMARAMMIYPPGPEHCPRLYFVNSIRFGPLQSITYSVDLKGNWTEGETPLPDGGFSEGILHPFGPGPYTFAAGDQWGRLVLRYFTVLASPA